MQHKSNSKTHLSIIRELYLEQSKALGCKITISS